MKNNFSLAMVVGWVTALSLAGSAYAQTVEIGTWAGFRTAAVSFTFDDGAPSHVTDVGPLFDNYGFKATFNLVTNWNPNWTGFQGMASNGHEIASHSDNHGNPMPNNEIASSKATINDNIKNNECITLAYPNCTVPDEATVLQNYIAGRICGNGSEVMGKDGPSNWAQVPAIMTGVEQQYSINFNSVNQFTGKMQEASQKGGWVMFLTHGLAGKSNNGNATFSPTDLSVIDGALSWASTNDIWVGTFRDVAMYIKERKASSATASTSGNSITVKLAHNIADNISNYDYPLSIRVQNSNNWTSVSATQGGKAITASIKDGYIYFDAVPNGGDIVISNGSGTTPISSSSATVPASSYSITSSGSTISITVEMEDYDQGGQGVAYNDLNYSEMEKYVTYRTDDAGIVSAGDGYAIGYTKTGEWFNYTMSVPCTGQYKVLARASTGNSSNTKFTISAVGAEPLQVSVSPTTSWDIYAEIDAGTVRLTEGSNSFKVSIDDDNVNVDWIKFIADGVQCPGIVPPQSSASGDNSSASGGNSSASGGDNSASSGNGSDSSEQQGNASGDVPEAIPMVGDIHWIDFSGEIYCQVFDMKGQLLRVKSGAASQGAAGLWNAANKGLRKGVYIMRYGRPGSVRTIQVRK